MTGKFFNSLILQRDLLKDLDFVISLTCWYFNALLLEEELPATTLLWMDVTNPSSIPFSKRNSLLFYKAEASIYLKSTSHLMNNKKTAIKDLFTVVLLLNCVSKPLGYERSLHEKTNNNRFYTNLCLSDTFTAAGCCTVIICHPVEY